jgi:hypothetical protein
MDIVISGVSGNSRYCPAAIQREAQLVAKTAGQRLRGYFVELSERTGRATLKVIVGRDRQVISHAL